MPKRTSKSTDPNVIAKSIVDRVTSGDQPESPKDKKTPPFKKNPAAVALGRLGGKKGGKARAEKLTPEERKEIASKAARKRWSKRDA